MLEDRIEMRLHACTDMRARFAIARIIYQISPFYERCDMSREERPSIGYYWVGGAIYGGVLGALTAVSYRIFDLAPMAMWTVVGAVILAVFFGAIEWWGRAGE